MEVTVRFKFPRKFKFSREYWTIDKLKFSSKFQYLTMKMSVKNYAILKKQNMSIFPSANA